MFQSLLSATAIDKRPARVRRTGIAAMLVLLALGGCDRRADEAKVAHAWVRLPAIPGQPAAAYFTLIGGRSGEKLVQVESALAQRVELHDNMAGMGGMTAMTPLADVDLPAGASVTFAPGGKHAMVYGVDKAVTPGTAIPLRFGFASGRVAEAEAKTVAAGDDAPY